MKRLTRLIREGRIPGRLPGPLRHRFNRARVQRQLTEPPIVIGGCGRSGTTLLLSILSAHPRVFAIPTETRQFCPAAYADPPASHRKPRLDAQFYRHFDGLTRHAPHDRWCEKTPRNVLFFDDIIELFAGRVKLLHIVRDGRDVILSKHPTKEDGYWVDPDRWVQDTRAGMAFLDHPLVHTVYYEDLVRDNDRAVKDICAFLGLEFCEAISNWHQHATVRSNKAWDGEVKPIFESSIGTWRAPEHAPRVRELLDHPDGERTLRELGYLK
ncbi:MAG: sulfotransferase [Planctomycetota bacterium]